MDPSRLRSLCDPFDACPLECDGLTHVLRHVLAVAGVEHRVFVGRLGPGAIFHLWIEAGPYRIDYRARMWVPAAPHGVTLAEEAEPGLYRGEPQDLEPLPVFVLEALAWPAPLHLAADDSRAA